ncbi:Uncharacterised protein [Vibrio cholerae]|nr:Uncharacterised protein [Vibrio cholerae]
MIGESITFHRNSLVMNTFFNKTELQPSQRQH